MQKPFDLFICYAGEDRDEVVRVLADGLRTVGMRVFYDQFELRPGASLRRTIDLALSTARNGVVVLSPAFFGKSWPEWELNGLVNRHNSDNVTLIPIWHHVGHDDVSKYSPSLADIVALRTESGVPHLLRQLVDLFRPIRSDEELQAEFGPLLAFDIEPGQAVTIANPELEKRYRDAVVTWLTGVPSFPRFLWPGSAEAGLPESTMLRDAQRLLIEDSNDRRIQHDGPQLSFVDLRSDGSVRVRESLKWDGDGTEKLVHLNHVVQQVVGALVFAAYFYRDRAATFRLRLTLLGARNVILLLRKLGKGYKVGPGRLEPFPYRGKTDIRIEAEATVARARRRDSRRIITRLLIDNLLYFFRRQMSDTEFKSVFDYIESEIPTRAMRRRRDARERRHAGERRMVFESQ